MYDRYDRKVIIRNIVCVVVCVLLIGISMYWINSDKQAQEARVTENQVKKEEAKQYETELKELQNELVTLQNNLTYTSDCAKMIIGFLISDVSDLSYMDEKAESFGFSPVVIIDCMAEMDKIEEIIQAADSSREIMLYASNFTEDTNDRILYVMSYLNSIGRDFSDVFILRYSYSNSKNIQLLTDDGFKGYTAYNSESPKSGQSEDGAVYFDYSYLSSSDVEIDDRLTGFYKNKASMVMIFSMENINSGELDDDSVTDLLESFQKYADKDDCEFSTAAAVTDELLQINDIEEERQAEYEKQAAEIQQRIDELEETIHNIYN